MPRKSEIRYRELVGLIPKSKMTREERTFIQVNNIPPDKVEYYFGRRYEYWYRSNLTNERNTSLPEPESESQLTLPEPSLVRCKVGALQPGDEFEFMNSRHRWRVIANDGYERVTVRLLNGKGKDIRMNAERFCFKHHK